MKWLFYCVAFGCVFDRRVMGAKAKDKFTLEIETDSKVEYVNAGEEAKIACKGSARNLKLDWYDPNGKLVKHNPTSEVYAQDEVAKPLRSVNRLPKSVLTFKHAGIENSGIWVCRAGDVAEHFLLCVFDQAVFSNTTTEVTLDQGRSISLTCEAKGTPEPLILWYRDGQSIDEVENSTKYKVGTKFTTDGIEGYLTIMSLVPEDAGIYNCETVQSFPVADSTIDECVKRDMMNITLNVNHAPAFLDGNDSVVHVFGREDESVDLVCSAVGYPTPTYKWYQEFGALLSLFPQSAVNLSTDGTEAVLTLTANSSTFDKTYRCLASNEYGETYKYFTVAKLEKPRRPEEVIYSNSTDSTVELTLSWDGVVLFLIESFDVQYLKKTAGGTPREVHWRRAKEYHVDAVTHYGFEETTLVLPGLEEDTQYWVRVRVKNEAGESPWSVPTLTSTTEKPEDDVDIEEDDDENQSEQNFRKIEPAISGNGPVIGLFFTAAVIIFAGGCVLVIKRI